MTLDAIANKKFYHVGDWRHGAIPDYALVEDSGFVSTLIIGE